MNTLPRRLHGALLSTALLAGAVASAPAQATDVPLVANTGWTEFTVDNQVGPSYGTGWIDAADGSPLRFSFTVASGTTATLTVVDAGFAGDTYGLTDFGIALGSTSTVAVGSIQGPVVYDFDAALADPSFSRASFSLAAGTHLIGGQLVQSVLDATGQPLDATNGALRLSVVAAAVPEPSSLALLLGGLGLVAVGLRRRAGRDC